MPAIMQVKIGHIPFIEVAVPIRRLAPIVVPDLLPNLARLPANGEEPLFVVAPERDELDGIPEILPKCPVAQKAPVFVCSQDFVAAVGSSRFERDVRLSLSDDRSGKQRHRENGENMHQS